MRKIKLKFKVAEKFKKVFDEVQQLMDYLSIGHGYDKLYNYCYKQNNKMVKIFMEEPYDTDDDMKYILRNINSSFFSLIDIEKIDICFWGLYHLSSLYFSDIDIIDALSKKKIWKMLPNPMLKEKMLEFCRLQKQRRTIEDGENIRRIGYNSYIENVEYRDGYVSLEINTRVIPDLGSKAECMNNGEDEDTIIVSINNDKLVGENFHEPYGDLCCLKWCLEYLAELLGTFACKDSIEEFIITSNDEKVNECKYSFGEDEYGSLCMSLDIPGGKELYNVHADMKLEDKSQVYRLNIELPIKPEVANALSILKSTIEEFKDEKAYYYDGISEKKKLDMLTTALKLNYEINYMVMNVICNHFDERKDIQDKIYERFGIKPEQNTCDRDEVNCVINSIKNVNCVDIRDNVFVLDCELIGLNKDKVERWVEKLGYNNGVSPAVLKFV